MSPSSVLELEPCLPSSPSMSISFPLSSCTVGTCAEWECDMGAAWEGTSFANAFSVGHLTQPPCLGAEDVGVNSEETASALAFRAMECR